MDTPVPRLVSVVLALLGCAVVTSGQQRPLLQTWQTCILDVTLLDFEGQGYNMRDLCAAKDNRVTAVFHCVMGSRPGDGVWLTPCLPALSAASLQCGALAKDDEGSHMSMVVRLEDGEGEVIDSARHTLHPSQDGSGVLRVVGDLHETRLTVAVSQRCVTPDTRTPDPVTAANRLTHTRHTHGPLPAWRTLHSHRGQLSSHRAHRPQRDVRATRAASDTGDRLSRGSEHQHSPSLAAVGDGESGNENGAPGGSRSGESNSVLSRSAKRQDPQPVPSEAWLHPKSGINNGSGDTARLPLANSISRGEAEGTAPVAPVQTLNKSARPSRDAVLEKATQKEPMTSASVSPSPSPSSVTSAVDNLNDDRAHSAQGENLVVRGRQLAEFPVVDGQDSESDVTGKEADVSPASDMVTRSESGGLSSTVVKEEKTAGQNTDITDTSTATSEASTAPKAKETPTSSHDKPETSGKATSAPTTTPVSSQSSSTTTTIKSSTTDSKLTQSPDLPGSITTTKAAPTTPQSTKVHHTTSANPTTKTTTHPKLNTNSVTTTADMSTQGLVNSPTSQSATHTQSSRRTNASPSSTHTTASARTSSKTSTPAKGPQTPAKAAGSNSPSATPYTTLDVVTKSNSSGLARNSDTNDGDSSDNEDAFWPIVAALVIGIPSIIVIGIAIIVVHRRRRVASPSNRLRAASLYPS